ncbi:ATP-dependent DNA helicase [Sulfitobacter mediterraneus]|uniref:ATP-dependent DNA helicase n=1 Tax=Sulfitobacter mediterraneus TaxID=83219 RepID=UPI0024929125|nr:AAA family ATPase [Sulfitobacter mediterraneus]
MDGTTLAFSPQQIAAMNDVSNWLKTTTNRKQVFRLFGYAGTGKTTIAQHLAEGLDGDVVYAAFTGKAAMMMQRNGCTNASTIHKLIYRPEVQPDDSIKFKVNRGSDVKDAALVVIDECSMVDERLARDLMSFKKPILVLGDPAQLPPVKGAGYFTEAKPDVMLTEIHRQAGDSPVLHLATAVREGNALDYGTYGTSRVVPDEGLTLEDVLEADQLLVGRNVTRHHYNAAIRETLGRKSSFPEIGDRLVCLRNDHKLGIYNGGLFEVVNHPRQTRFSKTIAMRVKSLDFTDSPEIRVCVHSEFFTGTEARLSKKDLLKTQKFGYGYALTVHKSQGSQWENVIVLDESGFFPKEDRQSWLYTAITRASEKVAIVMP